VGRYFVVPVRGGAEVTKTLGQVAFEAWGAVVWDGDAGEYDHVVAPGWEAAAEAVVKHAPKHLVAKHFAEASAVIEAARAVNKYWKTSAPEKLEALLRAVEALEEVER
jgi:beta-galactosidase GanA